jgi:hypothetical protein
MMRPFCTALLLLVTGGAAACTDGATATSPSPTTESPATMTFASHLAQGGSTSRAFTVAAAGTITITLAAFGSGTETVGLGVGVPATGSPCSLTHSVTTAAGTAPQITVSADAGSYCVQLFDTGATAAETPISVIIQHP